MSVIFSYPTKKMVYKKYIKQGGKVYGPYTYESKRIGKRVVTKYVPASSPSSIVSWNSFWMILFALVLFGGFIWFSSYPTGNAILDVQSAPVLGEQLTGTLNLKLSPGELIPADTRVVVSLGNQSASLPLSALTDVAPVAGAYYVSGASLEGTGEGYGILGAQIEYPEITFQFMLTSSQQSASEDSSSDQNTSGNAESSESSEHTDSVISDVLEDSDSSENASVDLESAPSDSVDSDSDSGGDTSSQSSDSSSTSSDEALPASSDSQDAGTSVDSEENADSSGISDTSEEEVADLSLATITGNFFAALISEGDTMSGKVSKDSDFVYTLRGSEISAELLSGSVRSGETVLNDSVLQVSVEEKSLRITTDFSIQHEGFGKEYSSGNAQTLSFNLSTFGLVADAGTLSVKLVSGDDEIARIEQQLSVDASENVSEVLADLNLSSTNLSLIRDIPSLKLLPNTSMQLNLQEYFTGAETYLLSASNISGTLNGSVLMLKAEAGVRGTREAIITAFAGNESIESNRFDILISSGNLSVKKTRGTIRLGEPVRWTQNISLDLRENASVSLPKEAENISVKKVDEQGLEEHVSVDIQGITGGVIDGVDSERGAGLQTVFKTLMRFTLFAVQDGTVSENDSAVSQPSAETVEVTLSDNATQYVIEYTTDAPFAIEENTSTGKQVIISGPDGLNYTDVVSYTTIPESLNVGQEGSIKIFWEENSSFVSFDAFDTDENGKLDYLEWITPHLSNQTFNIILITRAEHLDENRTFVEDVYDLVSERDENFTTISSGHYLRAWFERNLTNVNDITLYAKSHNSGSVKVYEKDSDVLIADFGTLEAYQKYKIFLTNLSSVSQDTFDLYVSGGDVEFDQVIDPASSYTYTFASSVPANGSSQTSTSAIIDVDIETSNNGVDLLGLSHRFNGTTYNHVSNSIVYLNFDNLGVIGDTSTVATDLARTSQKADFFNGAAYTSSGRYNSGLQLDGTNDFANISYTSALNLGSGSFTIAWWEYRQGNDNGRAAIVRDSTNNYPGFLLGYSYGGSDLQIYMSSAGSSWDIANGRTLGAVTLNTWNHFVVTRSGNTFTAYKNGAQTDTWSSSGSFASKTAAISLGRYRATSFYYYYGRLDEVRIMTTALSSSEVNKMYNSHLKRYTSSTWNYLSNTTNQAGLLDGTYTLYVTATDTSGGMSNSSIRTFYIDNAAPSSITYNAPTESDGSTLSRSNIFANITAVDAVKISAITVRLYNSAHTLIGTNSSAISPVTMNWTGLANGQYHFNATVNDTLNNQLSAATRYVNISVDTTPPSARVIFPTNRTYSTSVSALNFSVSSDATACSYSLTGALSNISVTCGNNVTGLSSNQGANNWTVWAVDSAGNQNVSRISFSVDSVFPTINFTSPTPLNNSIGSNFFTVNVTFSELNFGNITFALYNSSSSLSLLNLTSFTSPRNFTTFTGLADGAYSYNVTLLDVASNSNTTELRSYLVDATRPSIVLTSPANTSTASLVSALNFSVMDTNIQACWYSTDNAVTNVSVTCGTNVTGLTAAQGANTWRVYANDSAGNENTSVVTFAVDSLFPVLNYTEQTESDGSFVARSNLFVNVSASDVHFANVTLYLYNLSHAVLRSNTTDTTSYALNYTSLNDGVYLFNVSSTDTLGNENWTGTRNVTLDTVSPTVAWGSGVASSGATLAQSSVFLNVSVTELNEANITFELFNASGVVNTTTFTDGRRSQNITALPNEAYTFNVTIVDRVGHQATSETLSVNLDTVLPSVVLVSPANTSYASLVSALNYGVGGNAQACWYSIDNAVTNVSVTCGTNVTGLISAQGTNTWRVYANDSAGNVNGTTTVTFFVDSLTPGISFVGSTFVNNTYGSDSLAVNVSFTEANFANVTYELYNLTSGLSLLNRTLFSLPVNFTNYTALADGRYAYNVSLLDTLNHQNVTETRVYTVDTIVPQISFSSSSDNASTNVSRSWVFVNVSVLELNEANLTFKLFNRTSLLNSTVFSSSVRTLNFTNLSDGTYFFNVSISDLASRENVTALQTITLDTSGPAVTNKSKEDTLQFGNVSLFVNVTDALSSVQAGYVTLLYPNGTSANFTLTLNENNFNITFVNLTQFGDYDVNYTLNDSLGNHRVVSEHFEVFIPLNVSGTLTDATGAAQEYTFEFLRPDSNVTLYNFSGSTYNFTGSELHQRVYDIVVRVGNVSTGQTVLLQDFNLTTSYVPIQLDNFTNISTISIANHKILTGIGVNTTFTGSALVNLSYAGFFNASEVAVNESNLTAYKCANWNYAARTCSGSFAQVSAGYVQNDTDRMLVNTTGFSSFVVAASTCGNSVCQSGFGETTSTCSADCPAASTGSSTSSSTGGGGGGGGSTIPAVSSTLQSWPDSVEHTLKVGERNVETLSFNNTGDTDLRLLFEADERLASVLSFEPQLFIPAHEHAKLTLVVFGAKEGVYAGTLSVTADGMSVTFPVLIVVKSFVEQLLDVSVVTTQKRVAPGDTLNFQVSTFNLGQSPRYDVYYTYDLVHLGDNRTITSFQESVALQTSLSLARTIHVPLDAPLGRYALRVDAAYNNWESKAIASATFDVGPASLNERLAQSTSLLFVVVGLVLICLVILLLLFLRNRSSSKGKSQFSHLKTLYRKKK